MRIIAIGDIHGRDTWKRIVEKETFDIVVFIGDYFDSFDIPSVKQIDNFKDILEFKRSMPDSVVLLCGNHDYHYISGVGETYSGYSHAVAAHIGFMLQDVLNSREIQMCFSYNKFLFSHAGITKTWCLNNNIDISNIEESINDTFFFKPKSFGFAIVDGKGPYGDDVEQSPIWVRPNSLAADGVSGYTHVVGHTQQNCIVGVAEVNPELHICLIDALVVQEYLIIENDVVFVGKA